MYRIVAVVMALGFVVAVPRAQNGSTEVRPGSFDELLDLYVRDGFVYYRSLKGDRRKLDAYLSSLASRPVASEPRDEQIAFWLNAYDALVLRTVIDHYPIVQRSRDYPAKSIRQIPGAFESIHHQVAAKSLTLDQIEQTILPGFADPRLFLAIGRGAIGSGRLRSEAFTAANLERQLVEVAAECTNRGQCANVDRPDNKVLISSIFSWRSKEFSDTYADRAPSIFGARSPIERAAIAFIQPKLTTTEKDFLSKNEFKVEFSKFDWSLNDLTGRGGR
jgi:hypothetical protein